MCKRDCIYRGGTIKKWDNGSSSCNYSGAMQLTNRKYKTRTKLLMVKVETRHPDWPNAKKAKWVREHLKGERCPFFEWNGQGGEPGKAKPQKTEPKQTARPERKEKPDTRKGKLDREKAMRLYRQGMNDQEIGEACGVSHGAIYAWRSQNELPANAKRGGSGGPNKVPREKMQELYDRGLRDEEIAERLGCAVDTVRKWRYAEGLDKNHSKKPRKTKADKQAQRYLEEKHAQEGRE